MTTRKWIVVSGLTWLAIGSMLMVKGLKWITQSMMGLESAPLVRWCSSLVGSAQQGALLVICISLFIGFIKGRTVLAKTVQRVVTRIRSLPPPILLSQVYDRRYATLLGSMMALGFLFRFLPIGADVRGAIDVAIGSALINGSMLYFREAVIPRSV
jgi:hypothetical protein